MATYHAFHCGKMNQSFRLEDERNQPLYEANLIKFKLLSACEYEFVNRRASSAVSHRIGKTVSVEHAVAGLAMSAASYFTIDGRNCFDLLEERGRSLRILPKLNILRPEFALTDANGNQIAVYKMNVPGEKEAGVFAIGGKQVNTVITTESDDLDTVFLGAFILSRVNFSLYLV